MKAQQTENLFKDQQKVVAFFTLIWPHLTLILDRQARVSGKSANVILLIMLFCPLIDNHIGLFGFLVGQNWHLDQADPKCGGRYGLLFLS